MTTKLRELARTSTGVVLSGTLEDCQALAARLGMQVEEYRGRILWSEGLKAVYAPHTETDWASCTYAGGGLLQRGRDDYTIVVPLHRWRD